PRPQSSSASRYYFALVCSKAYKTFQPRSIIILPQIVSEAIRANFHFNDCILLCPAHGLPFVNIASVSSECVEFLIKSRLVECVVAIGPFQSDICPVLW